MSNGSENNLDPLLKTYARKRREDAGPAPEMPSATRTFLQAEVARTFRKTAETPAWLRLVSGFWPRLAFGGGLLAVLVIAALVSLQSERKTQQWFALTKNLEDQPLSVPSLGAAAADREAPDLALTLTPDMDSLTATKPALDAERGGFMAPPPAEASAPLAKDKAQTKADALAKSLSPNAPVSAGTSKLSAETEAIDRNAGTLASSSSIEKQGPLAATETARTQGLASAPDGGRSGANVRKLESALPAERAAAPAPAESLNLGIPDASASKPALAPDSRGEPAQDNYALRLYADKKSVPLAETSPRQTEFSNTLSIQRPVSLSNSAEAVFFQRNPARGSAGNDGNPARLLFNQANSRTNYRRNFNSPPMPNVLASFELQRQGNNVLVIDADGSFYEGTIQAQPQAALGRLVSPAVDELKATTLQTNREAREVQTRHQALPGSNQAEAQAIENFSFRAIGTNRSLNQKVVFTGNYLNSSQALPFGETGLGGGGQANLRRGASVLSSPQTIQADTAAPNQSVSANGAAPSLPMPSGINRAVQVPQNERIEGRASIGGTNEFPIEALRVGP